jgi:uncharacterized membrane protein YbhN (UPF0104 family)
MQPTQWRKWLLLAGKLAVVAVLAWWVHDSIRKGLEELGKHSWQAQPGWIALSGLLYLAAMFPSALYMQRLLVATGQDAPLPATLRAFYVSQVGKYTPGKAMVVLLRIALLRRPGIEGTVVAAAAFAETLTTMAVGSFWAMVLLIVWHRDSPGLIAAAGAMFLATGLPTLPHVMQWLIRLLGVSRINPTAAEKLGNVPYGTLAAGWLGISLAWPLYALSLWAALRGLGQDAHVLHDMPLHLTSVALSVVAGFLALIPGGLGVREFVLLKLLLPRYGETVAIVSVGLLRLVWLVAEVLISAILYPCGRRRVSPPVYSPGADEPALASPPTAP